MRFPAVLLLVILLSTLVWAQDAGPTPTPETAGTPAVDIAEEAGTLFRAAVAEKDPEAREKALEDYLAKYPDSESALQAKELLVAARAELGGKAIQAGNREEGLRLLRLAVTDAPSPVSDGLFTGVLLHIPNNLFFSGMRESGYEFAKLIEEKISGNARQLVGLATFYVAVEDAGNAKRLAEKAIELSPELPAAYQTLGLASRLDFDLEAAEAAYSKALELDPSSLVSKRSLAELKRAVGKPEVAIKLYDEIITADPSNANAGTGRTLALFDAGRLEEAESAKDTILSVNPKNLVLLVGTAYWYAAHGEPAKAVAYAKSAVSLEPRYTWAHIALARGLIASGQPLEAERVLLGARQYGNFPTLEYELASARLRAGFFRDASDALTKTFSLTDSDLQTRLGGRVEKRADNFLDLLSLERKASIFEPVTADDPDTAERLKRLLRFTTLIAAGSDPAAVISAADAFVAGDDPMRVHREIYAAGRLLEKKTALEEAESLAESAANRVDKALEVPAPSAAVLADELYERRQAAFARGTVIVVPDLPDQTLSRIVRGRIEEIIGWARFAQNDDEQAAVHLRRALGILPKDSAWSRSVHWKLGTVLESQGQAEEALENYIAGYRGGGEDAARKIVVEGLYKKLNGSLEGLKEKLEAAPVQRDAKSTFLKESAKESAGTEGSGSEKPEASADDATANPAKEQAEPVNSSEGNAVTSPEGTGEDLRSKKQENVEKSQPVENGDSNTQKKDDAATSEVPQARSGDASGSKKEETAEKTQPVEAGNPDVEKKDDEAKKSFPAADGAVSPTVLDDIEQASRESMAKIDFDKPMSGTEKGKPKEKAAENGETSQKAANASGAADEGSGKVPAQPEERTAGAISDDANSKVPANDASGEGEPSGASGKPATRPRKVAGERSRLAGDDSPVRECSLVLSQDAVVLTSNGGSAGVLAGIEGRTGVFRLKAVSGSPEDVAVAVDSTPSEVSGSAVFVIRSISASKGIFTVTFQSSCGSRDVRVTVR